MLVGSRRTWSAKDDSIDFDGRHQANSFGFWIASLHEASSHGHHDIVASLLDGANLNMPEQLSFSATGSINVGASLHIASRNGFPDIVRLLLQRGVDPNSQVHPEKRHPYGFRGVFDQTSLQEASAEGHLEIVQLLLERGASVNQRNSDDPYDTSAIDHASAGGHVDVVHLLLQHGADLELREESYQTLLESMARRGDANDFQALLQKGSKIDTEMGAYGTAMLAASTAGHFGIVKMLLEQANADKKALTDIYPSA
ncbi:NACHT and ankyrin domain protein [Colletotrichum sojae]|uniref:NACHT and ankyrin domain protein n=1 Tax=Colletotrichum sojae TaxID=2175907 RepID=A0A8H6IWP6_9PEZI|nr:NACHT and ankyrin domain protein [Colletotrichum sojae]